MRHSLLLVSLTTTLMACHSPTDSADGEGRDSAGGEGPGFGGATSASGASQAVGASAVGGDGSGGHGAAPIGGRGGEESNAVWSCFEHEFANPPTWLPDYDAHHPVVGAHCFGTQHQSIKGVERVVYLGDSLTVGTPPTAIAKYHRSRSAESLSTWFDLEAPSYLWKTPNPFKKTASIQSSGDFQSCAKWGGRVGDLPGQFDDCFGDASEEPSTLIVLTIGGNDLNDVAKAAVSGAPQAELWASAQAIVDGLDDALTWIHAPGRFPNGVFVVFGNIYDFTDQTGDVHACDVSALTGFDEPVSNPEEIADLLRWLNEQYLGLAVTHQVDMLFLAETFCGHGFNAGDPSAPCYRGPGNDRWFDLTCIHPNATGHAKVSEMLMSMVSAAP